MKLLPLLLNAAVVKLQAFEKIPLSRTKHHWASLAWAALHSASRTMLLWINLLRSWTSKDSPSTIFTRYSPLGLPTCSKQRMPVALHQPSPVKSTRLLVERPWAKLWMLENLINQWENGKPTWPGSKRQVSFRESPIASPALFVVWKSTGQFGVLSIPPQLLHLPVCCLFWDGCEQL